MGLGIKSLAKSIGYLLTIRSSKRNETLDALLLCHALEKGMGMKDARAGFGQEKCKRLIGELEALAAKGQTATYEFQESVAVLGAYFEFQTQNGVDLDALRSQAEPLLAYCEGSVTGGFQMHEEKDFLVGETIDFPTFVATKRSLRLCSDAPINESDFIEAIDLAKRAPSACNREPWKVHYSLDKQKSAQIADALPKQGFLKDIPYYCVVTADRSLFNRSELFQWFVNGGIFLSYFTLALHYKGIGSCIFEYNLFSQSAKSLRTIARIHDSEEIIAVVGYGKYPTRAKCICADRRPSSQIAVKF